MWSENKCNCYNYKLDSVSDLSKTVGVKGYDKNNTLYVTYYLMEVQFYVSI